MQLFTQSLKGLEEEIASLKEQLRNATELNLELARTNVRLAELATSDDLTGLKNRRHAREAISVAFSLAKRHEQPLSAALVDVDQFKAYNDTFGHKSGDIVLCTIADLLQGVVRNHDMVSRHGGEEFLILLPATGPRGSRIIAERLRGVIAGHPWPLRPITASFGVATMTEAMQDANELVEQADRALYHSKRTGRDRVTHRQDIK
jgi:diguanylate cyclase (GGDEF)-like protein